MKIIKKKRKQIIRRDIKRNLNIKKFRPSKNSKNNRFFSTPKLYYIITEYCPEGKLFKEIRKLLIY